MSHNDCAKQDLMSRSYLQRFYRYDHETGVLYHTSDSPVRYAGRPVGTPSGHGGHLSVKHRGIQLKAHRMAWAIFHGSIDASMQIDHINGDPVDNRIANLRLVTNKENHKNKVLTCRNKTGIHGVEARGNKFRVTIQNVHIGYFIDFFEACCARKVEELRRVFHVNHGRSRRAMA